MSTNLRKPDDLLDFDMRLISLLGQLGPTMPPAPDPSSSSWPRCRASVHVSRFARWICEAGFTDYITSLSGIDGDVPGAEEGSAVFRRACMGAEFGAFGRGASLPATHCRSDFHED